MSDPVEAAVKRIDLWRGGASYRELIRTELLAAEARGRKAGMEAADAELRNLRQKCVTGDARDSLLYIAQEAIRAAAERLP